MRLSLRTTAVLMVLQLHISVVVSAATTAAGGDITDKCGGILYITLSDLQDAELGS